MEQTAAALQGECDHSQLVSADLNGDGIGDVAALYSIVGVLGGSNHVQHLAVFLGDAGGGLTLAADEPVGARGVAVAEAITGIAGAVVSLETAIADPDDLAGPGLPGRAAFELVGEELRAL